MKINYKGIIAVVCLVSGLLLFLLFTFHFDNKYTASMPLPKNSVLNLNASDIDSGKPIFLIDDWFYCDGTLDQWSKDSATRTYIGEYSNFKHKGYKRHALGQGTYNMYINYTGNSAVTTLQFPELFSDYKIYWDNNLIQSGKGTAKCDIVLTQGFHTLSIFTSSNYGYYSGMYYPAMMGSTSAIDTVNDFSSFLHSIAFLMPLILALFCMALWKNSTLLYKNFAFLCLSFAVYMSYYFVQLWNLPFAVYWYPIEDISFYAFLYFALSMSTIASGMTDTTIGKIAKFLAISVPIIEIFLYFITHVSDIFITAHGIIQDFYRVFIFIALILSSIKTFSLNSKERILILMANLTLGISLLFNLLYSNLYEPIYGFWQFEWCGLILVCIFAYFMSHQNKRILLENINYQNSLEDMVSQRTEQLNHLLDERRAFFADMAHDLKAPLFATKTFISMIRQHSVGLDSELLFFIDQVEKKQKEMSTRVKSLNELNSIDKITEPPCKISVRKLLDEVYHTHNPEAVVSKIHLLLQQPKEDLYVLAQQEKLLVVFENLIYNSFRFTPENGIITLSANSQNGSIKFVVRDSGCGISEDKIPRVFERFFTGQDGKDGGTGLGLYIAKAIIEEAGGSIAVSSKVGIGTEFSFILPKIEK